jgi:hypothetical protein
MTEPEPSLTGLDPATLLRRADGVNDESLAPSEPAIAADADCRRPVSTVIVGP